MRSSWPRTMPRSSAASSGAMPATTARSALARIRSSRPGAPPRRSPVTRARSSRSSPAIPRRRRWPAKAPGPRAFVRPSSRSSEPGRADPGSGDQRGIRRSRRARFRRPSATSISADAPKRPGRGAVRRCARRSTLSPSRRRAAGASIAASRSSPARAPASTTAAAIAPSRAAPMRASTAKHSAETTTRSSTRASARARPRAAAATTTW